MAGEDPRFASWIRTLPCAVVGLDPHGCQGTTQAYHAGPRGLGQKAHDNTCIPLCLSHHRAYHDYRWPFSTMPKAELRAWIDQQIRMAQSDHARLLRQVDDLRPLETGGQDVPE
jgi:hypothetical protein